MSDLSELANKLANADPKHSVVLENGFVLSLIRERDAMRGHLRGMCDAYELLCQQAGMNYHESPSSKYAAARQALKQEQPA